ncbi:hypothetical protein D3C72_2097660 [compost metagenome]
MGLQVGEADRLIEVGLRNRLGDGIFLERSLALQRDRQVVDGSLGVPVDRRLCGVAARLEHGAELEGRAAHGRARPPGKGGACREQAEGQEGSE